LNIKRILNILIIKITDEEDFLEHNCIKLFDAIKEEYPELNFCFLLQDQYYSNYKLTNFLMDYDLKYDYILDDFISDWDTLYGIMNFKPKGMYIVNGLGFEIKDVAEVLHNNGIEVRCFPNVAQSKWNRISDLKKFFIRPEDMAVYEKYIDVCEIFGDTKRISTYYKIYAKDKKWLGLLSDLIISYNEDDLNNQYLLPTFGKYRLNCGKRCFKGHGCQICDATKQLSAILEENNIIIKKA